MDYSSVLKSLAREAGIPVPLDAFNRPSLGRRQSASTEGLSKCGKCGEPRTSIGWCKPCDTNRLKTQFGSWTSGNKDLDDFIKETQSNANTPFDYMRWIPFKSFSDLEFVAEGGFGSVFSAKSDAWGKVALKFLDNSEGLTHEFLDELRAYHRCSLGSKIIDCYGVSKDIETNRYVLVMRYAEHGNLRRYLSQYFSDLSWDEKIRLFDHIAKALKGIHDAGLVHRDFHSGNILRHEKLVYVTDLGMCRPVNETEDSKQFYGVLPYVAPEVLRGAPYKRAADVYSLGMIMWEMSSNEPPFSDRAHDYTLAEEICNGLRPPIISGTPKGYVAAMLRCWDADPSRRPTTDELLEASHKWRYLTDGKEPFQGPKTKKVKTGAVKSVLTNSNVVHPQAFYTSRLLHYPNLPEPRNSDTYTLFDSTTGEIHSMVRKHTSKRGSSRSSAMFTGDLLHHTTDNKMGKASENSHIGSSRGDTLIRSNTMSKLDKDLINRIRVDRKRLSQYKWSSYFNDIPKQVELSTIDDLNE